MFFIYSWWTYVILMPGILLGIWAQFRVHNTFSKYKKVSAVSGLSANEVARKLLRANGCGSVDVRPISGSLTDHYNPKDQTLSLSKSTFSSCSVAAIGIAAHEVGHAVQHEQGYTPLRLRSILVPVTNIGSMLAVPLVLIGILLEILLVKSGASKVGTALVAVGVIGYGLATLFALVTLPVELNASRRAKQMLTASGILTKAETRQAGKVLSAAALTYVAAFVTSLLYFLRFLLIISALRGKRD